MQGADAGTCRSVELFLLCSSTRLHQATRTLYLLTSKLHSRLVSKLESRKPYRLAALKTLGIGGVKLWRESSFVTLCLLCSCCRKPGQVQQLPGQVQQLSFSPSAALQAASQHQLSPAAIVPSAVHLCLQQSLKAVAADAV